MKKRWKPSEEETSIKRTFTLPHELWEWARRQPGGGAGLIRRLLEQERQAQETRRVLSVETPGGQMQAAVVENGLVLVFEDDLIASYVCEPGQPHPVLTISAVASQVLSIPLQPGQTLTLPTPVVSLASHKARARAKGTSASIPSKDDPAD